LDGGGGGGGGGSPGMPGSSVAGMPAGPLALQPGLQPPQQPPQPPHAPLSIMNLAPATDLGFAGGGGGGSGYGSSAGGMSPGYASAMKKMLFEGSDQSSCGSDRGDSPFTTSPPNSNPASPQHQHTCVGQTFVMCVCVCV
jgi:hypothetical protein